MTTLTATKSGAIKLGNVDLLSLPSIGAMTFNGECVVATHRSTCYIKHLYQDGEAITLRLATSDVKSVSLCNDNVLYYSTHHNQLFGVDIRDPPNQRSFGPVCALDSQGKVVLPDGRIYSSHETPRFSDLGLSIPPISQPVCYNELVWNNRTVWDPNEGSVDFTHTTKIRWVGGNLHFKYCIDERGGVFVKSRGSDRYVRHKTQACGHVQLVGYGEEFVESYPVDVRGGLVGFERTRIGVVRDVDFTKYACLG